MASNNPNLEWEMLTRQPLAISQTLKTKTVGVAGLGGLGSVVAENLARAGVGHLVLIDFDIIEPSNLNRQRYFVDQLGRPKVEALAENIERFAPFVRLTMHGIKVTAENSPTLFENCDVVAECFDNPESKAALITSIRKNLPETPIVAASGMAGLDDAMNIKIEKRMEHVYIVGDQISDARDNLGLFASRVGVVASMQSHQIIRLLAGVAE